jgi:hypothetical protein
MPTLHVRNVPDELYERLRRRASAENRSLSAEVLELLDTATRLQPEATSVLFERIRRRRGELQQASGTFPPSVDLLRADRER